MLDIAKRTSAGMGLLMILPLLARLYHWYGQDNAWWTTPLRWLTFSVSWPWVMVSHIVLCGWVLWCLRLRLRAALLLCLLLCAALFTGQAAKIALKSQVREPPPCIVWQHIPAQQFYQMPHEQREHLLDTLLLQHRASTPAVNNDWQKASDRAFPSGHTLFAAIWLLLVMGILPPAHSKTQLVILIWAEMVMLSQLLLDMSWPRDLLASILLGWLISNATCWLAQYICQPHMKKS